jgi:hypothetical protein
MPMTTNDLVAALDVTSATIAKMIKDGRLPPPTHPRTKPGTENVWADDAIAPYLPGGERAARKNKPGRKRS